MHSIIYTKKLYLNNLFKSYLIKFIYHRKYKSLAIYDIIFFLHRILKYIYWSIKKCILPFKGTIFISVNLLRF